MRKSILNFGILAFAVAMLMLLPASAKAEYLDFLVDESVVAETTNSFEADSFNGYYKEILSFDGEGNFAATLIAGWSTYLKNEGEDGVTTSFLSLNQGEFASENNYGMYTIYTATGTISQISATEFGFNTTTGSAEIWLDLDSNTNLEGALPAVGGVYPTLSDIDDDEMILSASTIYFERNVLEMGVGGYFDIRFSDPTLTAFGSQYWPSLVGISFLTATVDGDFNEFNPLTEQGFAQSGGDLSANFTVVPEPSTLVLFGLGLIGTAVAIRRKR